MKAVLGLKLNPWHDTGAAIVVEKDGKLCVTAISQERLDRVKHSRAFPGEAIEYCLDTTGCRLDDLRLVVSDFIICPGVIDVFPDAVDPQLFRKVKFFKTLEEKNIPVLFVEHHLCHAASAYYSTNWEDAVGLVIDGHGSFYETQTIFSCEGKSITKLATSHQPGIGWMYAVATEVLLGFEHLQEGKTMGLSGWTSSDDGWRGKFLPNSRSGGFHETIYPQFLNHAPNWRPTAPIEMPRRLADEDPTHKPFVQYAFCAQAELERGVMKLLRYAASLSPKRRLCYSGGVALNILANRLIHDSGLFDEVFIQPAASDSGIPLGAALLGYYSVLGGMLPWKMEHAFLAREYPYHVINNVISEWNGPIEEVNLNKLAKILKNNYLVGWYQGAAEFGPRALGHRSIICSPNHSQMKNYLNIKVKHREMFRPFAPIVPIDKQIDFFDLRINSPYMLFNSMVRQDKVSLMPAIVHADGSARVQSIDPIIHPDLFTLLNEMGKITGIPVLLNTSLNLAGEPIVETPVDAFELFYKSQLDALFIENRVLSKKSMSEMVENINPALQYT